jgi:hypothetical protein
MNNKDRRMVTGVVTEEQLGNMIDAATMTFLHVRLRVRDGEFEGASVALVETMKNLAKVHRALQLRARQERNG